MLLWNHVLSVPQNVELYGNNKALKDLPDRSPWFSVQNNQPLPPPPPLPNNTRLLISKDKYNAPSTIPNVDYMGNPVVVLAPGETVTTPVKNPLNGDRVLQNTGYGVKPELYKGSSKTKLNYFTSNPSTTDNSVGGPTTVRQTMSRKNTVRRKFQPKSSRYLSPTTTDGENGGDLRRSFSQKSSSLPSLQPPDFKGDPIVVYPENSPAGKDPTYERQPPSIDLTPARELVKLSGAKPTMTTTYSSYQSTPIVVEDSTYEPQPPSIDLPSSAANVVESTYQSTPIVVADDSPSSAPDVVVAESSPEIESTYQSTPIVVVDDSPNVVSQATPTEVVSSTFGQPIYQSTTPAAVEDPASVQSPLVDATTLPPPPPPPPQLADLQMFQSTTTPPPPLHVDVSTYSPEKHYCGDDEQRRRQQQPPSSAATSQQIATAATTTEIYQHRFLQQQPLFPLPSISPPPVSAAPEPFDDRKTFKPLTLPSLQPSSLQPPSLQPASLQPSSLLPSSLQPSSLQPSSLQPASLQPPSAIKKPFFEYAPYYYLPNQYAPVDRPSVAARPLITIPPSHEIVRELYAPQTPLPLPLPAAQTQHFANRPLFNPFPGGIVNSGPYPTITRLLPPTQPSTIRQQQVDLSTSHAAAAAIMENLKPAQQRTKSPYEIPLLPRAPYRMGYEHLYGPWAQGGYSYQYFDRNPHLSPWAKLSPKPVSFVVIHPVSRPVHTEPYKPLGSSQSLVTLPKLIPDNCAR